MGNERLEITVNFRSREVIACRYITKRFIYFDLLVEDMNFKGTVVDSISSLHTAHITHTSLLMSELASHNSRDAVVKQSR